MKERKRIESGKVKPFFLKQAVDPRFLTALEAREAEEEGWTRITSSLKRLPRRAGVRKP